MTAGSGCSSASCRAGWTRDLRRRSAAEIVDLDLPGYAIGGLSVGEPTSAMREMTDLAADLLPAGKPRYLMGVGFPDDILASVAAGVDMFDCVLPTRMARTGTVLTRDGRLVVKNQEYAADASPLDAGMRLPGLRAAQPRLHPAPLPGQGNPGTHPGHHPQPSFLSGTHGRDPAGPAADDFPGPRGPGFGPLDRG